MLRAYWKPLSVAAAVALIVLIAVIVTWGGDDGSSPAASDLPTSTTTIPGDGGDQSPEATAPPEPVSRNPLTGAPLDTPSDQQVIAVRVGNGDAEHPQAGLGEAGLIYETLLEGGETRFIALYFGEEPNSVGPVRSIRPVDAAIVAPFAPLFAFSGGQDFVYRLVQAAGVAVIDETDVAALTRSDGVAPHNLFLDYTTALTRAIGGPPRVAPLPFSGDWQPAGESADQVSFRFGSRAIEYVFDAGGGYLRSQDGIPFEVLGLHDLETLTRDTVVIQFVAQRSAGYSDVAGAEVPDFDVVGFGEALVFHEGEAVEVEWRRASQASGTLFFDAEGEPFALPSGQLIIELVPIGTEVTFG
jgi:hypothetical protein